MSPESVTEVLGTALVKSGRTPGGLKNGGVAA
jgi:hypothetical protein